MIRALWLVGVTALLTACSGGTDPSPRQVNPRADPSSFFAGDLPGYAQDLGGSARSQLAVLRAIRRIDPCALVPKEALAEAQPPLKATASGETLDSCRLSFADDGPGEHFDLTVLPTTSRNSDEQYFEVDGQAVYKGRSGDIAICSFFFDSGLAKLPGAPRDVPDAQILVRAFRHDKPCDLAAAVATAVVKAKAPGLPKRADSAKVFEADPCAAVAEVEQAPSLDFAQAQAYHCEFVTRPEDNARERTGWVDFHRLPEALTAKFQAGQESGVQVWSDSTATSFADLLAQLAPPRQSGQSGQFGKGGGAGKSTSAGKTPAPYPSTKPKPPSGPHCAAYAKAPEAGTAQPDDKATALYVVAGGEIDCAEAMRLASSTAKALAT